MFDWRVDKKPGGMTAVCQEFSATRGTLKDKIAKAHGAKGNAVASGKKNRP